MILVMKKGKTIFPATS